MIDSALALELNTDRDFAIGGVFKIYMTHTMEYNRLLCYEVYF
jgi:hypothetical protein